MTIIKLCIGSTEQPLQAIDEPGKLRSVAIAVHKEYAHYTVYRQCFRGVGFHFYIFFQTLTQDLDGSL